MDQMFWLAGITLLAATINGALGYGFSSITVPLLGPQSFFLLIVDVIDGEELRRLRQEEHLEGLVLIADGLRADAGRAGCRRWPPCTR